MKKLALIAIALLLLPSLASAAQSYFDIIGLETGDSSEAISTAGTFSVQTSTVRTGTYALRVNPTTTGTGSYGVTGPLRTTGAIGNNLTNVSATSTFARFYFRYATKPAANYEEIAMLTISGGANQRMGLVLNSSGTISMYGNSTSTEILAGTTVLAANTWYRIEFDMRTGTTPSFLMKLNGATELSTSSVSLGAGNLGVLRLGKNFNSNGQTVDFFYDDIAVTDTDFPADGAVKMLVPNASGTYQTWTNSTSTCSHWSCVDEVPPTTTDYMLSTGVVGDAETEAMQDTATVGITGTVNAVKSYANQIRNGAISGSIKLRMRSGATDSDTGSALASGSSVSEMERLYNTDPNTSAAWTLSGVDSVEVGLVENATNTTRMHVTYAMVDVLASTSSPSVASTTPSLIRRGWSIFKGFLQIK